MSLGVVQSVSASGNQVSSVTTTGINTTTGNLLVADIALYDGQTFVSLTDNNGLTWSTAVAEVHGAGTLNRLIQMYSPNISGRTGHTFTLTISGSTNGFPTLAVKEISGAAKTSPLDVTSSASDGSNTTSHSSGTTSTRSQADEILCGAGSENGAGGGSTQTPGSGFTADQNLSGTTTQTALISESHIVSSVGTDAATYTSSASTQYNSLVATYKAAVVIARFRRTLSGVGTRTGSRQVHGWN